MFLSTIEIFCLYVIIYYAVHSLLISNSVKSKLNFKRFRIVFNLFAVLTIVPIAIKLIDSISQTEEASIVSNGIGIGIILLGVIIHLITFRWFSSAEFLGLKEVADQDQSIITGGIYSTCRHPFYLGTLLMFWGLCILFPNVYFVSFATLSSLYVLIGSRLEENKLIELHRDEYTNYRNEIPMLLPWKKPLAFLRFLFLKE